MTSAGLIPVHRALHTSIWLAPLLFAAVGAVVGVQSGQPGFGVVFAVLLGAVIGCVLMLLLSGMALLSGQVSPTLPPLDHQLRQLELDKRVLLRTIKEIEYDANLKRVTDEQARRLIEPLRKRTVSVLREIDVLRTESHESPTRADAAMDGQIEEELQRRLAAHPPEKKGR